MGMEGKREWATDLKSTGVPTTMKQGDPGHASGEMRAELENSTQRLLPQPNGGSGTLAPHHEARPMRHNGSSPHPCSALTCLLRLSNQRESCREVTASSGNLSSPVSGATQQLKSLKTKVFHHNYLKAFNI